MHEARVLLKTVDLLQSHSADTLEHSLESCYPLAGIRKAEKRLRHSAALQTLICSFYFHTAPVTITKIKSLQKMHLFIFSYQTCTDI